MKEQRSDEQAPVAVPSGASRAGPARDDGRDRGYVGTPPLPDQPAVSAPAPDSTTMAAPPKRAQPLVGLAGLTFVVPLFFLLAVGVGGPVTSLQVLAPLTTFALPLIAMIAFWWEDWPGSTLRSGWSGLTDTLIVVAGGVGATLLGQAVIAHFDAGALFDPDPGAGHLPTFPFGMPVAAGVFTVILQLTLVCEGWPLRRLGRVVSGVVALLVAWGIGVGAYLLLVGLVEPATDGLRDPGGPVAPAEYGAWLTVLGAAQLLFFVALRGWPFNAIRRRGVRLPVANAVVIAVAWGGYLILRHALGRPADQVTAFCGCFIAAALLVAMLFDAWPWIKLRPLPGRTGVVVTSLALTAGLYWALHSYADTVSWGRSHPQDWVAYGALNAIGVAVILHVAIWKRWPAVVGAGEAAPRGSGHTTAREADDTRNGGGHIA